MSYFFWYLSLFSYKVQCSRLFMYQYEFCSTTSEIQIFMCYFLQGIAKQKKRWLVPAYALWLRIGISCRWLFQGVITILTSSFRSSTDAWDAGHDIHGCWNCITILTSPFQIQYWCLGCRDDIHCCWNCSMNCVQRQHN